MDGEPTRRAGFVADLDGAGTDAVRLRDRAIRAARAGGTAGSTTSPSAIARTRVRSQDRGEARRRHRGAARRATTGARRKTDRTCGRDAGGTVAVRAGAGDRAA